MVMIVRVTLHHVSPTQISLSTTATEISLSTTGRRKYVLRRQFPRGIECDDSQTTARMEGNGTLVVELPITHLPDVTPGASAEPAPTTKRPASRKRAVADDVAAPSAARREGRGGSGGGSSRKAADDVGSVLELAEEATAAESERHELGLRKMRRVQEADAERAEKASQRNRQKEVQKQQSLEALRKHKKEGKKQAKKERAHEATDKAPRRGSGRRVSFA